MLRLTLFTAVVVLFSGSLFAEASDTLPSDGSVLLRLAGDVAGAYLRAEGRELSHDGIKVEIPARVVAKLSGGMVLIRYSRMDEWRGDQDQIVTLSAVVSASQLTTRTIPKELDLQFSQADFGADKPIGNAWLFSAEAVGRTPATDRVEFILELSELKDVRIRTWKRVTNWSHCPAQTATVHFGPPSPAWSQ